MEITLKKPLWLYETGKREHQEDYIYPFCPTENVADSSLFIVCDGMGGANKGEEASKLSCEVFSAAVNYYLTKSADLERIYLQSFSETQKAFDRFIEENPEAEDMATTLIALHFHSQGATVIHCGDSRLYHIREEKLLWQTKDHTVVNELLKLEMLTEEEAEIADNNALSKYIESHKAGEMKPDIHFIKAEEIAKGDYFLLCSDGVSNSITDDDICAILSERGRKVGSQIDIISNLCEANATDNYSAYLLEIENIVST